MVLLLPFLACVAAPPEPPEPPEPVDSGDPVAPITLARRGGDHHSAALHVDTPMEVTCRDEAGEDPRPALYVEEDVVLRGLLAGSTYRCEGADGAATYTTPPLPEDLPLATLVTPDDDAGWHLVNLVDAAGGWIVILDAQGRVRWALPGERFLGGLDATWMDQGVLFGGEGVAPTLVDLDQNVLWRADVTLASPDEKPGGWNHDAGPAADHQSVYALSNENIVHGDGNLVSHTLGFVVKQISLVDGSLLWAWSSTVDGAGLLEPVGADPFHANAVWDVGDLVLVNLRNMSQILGIERSTRAVRWRLGRDGDFALVEADGTPAAPERWFLYEHDTKLIDGLLYVFDNSMEFADPTRVLVLAIDEEARTARIVREWTRLYDGQPWHAMGWGGLDPLEDGGLSVAFGIRGEVPSSLFHLDAASDAITWEIEFDLDVGLYRSERFDPFYVSDTFFESPSMRVGAAPHGDGALELGRVVGDGRGATRR